LVAAGISAPLGIALMVSGGAHFAQAFQDYHNNGTSWNDASNNTGISFSANFTPNWGVGNSTPTQSQQQVIEETQHYGPEAIPRNNGQLYTSVNTGPDLSMSQSQGGDVSLLFDGESLYIRRSGKPVSSVRAYSGKPQPDGTFDYSEANQAKKGKGPIPAGDYYIQISEIQYMSRAANLLGQFGIGNWKGGERSWGGERVFIHPDQVDVSGTTRNGFSIHGGYTPGSAGCIDVTNNTPVFFGALRYYSGAQDIIYLQVSYPSPR
jgi:hypothetical protein